MLSRSRFYHCALLNFFFFHLRYFFLLAEILFSGVTVPLSFGGMQKETGGHVYVVKKHNNFPFVT
ncbi:MULTISPECIES: hypothetical protein [Klebsiella]|uniref:Uncharacterized protein n=2 Tax=Klebsiella grimontii TaxID=2058152 RepID=A0A285AYQ4_9ENTR|nr:hypothetical protein [Klebsiella grimontii]KZT48454.1 hypothetical protein A6A30_03425 [Klebsiella michiganensis]MDU7869462.1 hypothetical protein [Pantoea sp.]OQR51239.1 hypothetical protein BI322_20385 [Klebsiella oxytoca]PMT95046.1 hypothetical protein AFB28_19195 [Klebsiella sp. Kd70 TUC-EEAOC]PLL61214.1 hypothetical protein CWN04_00335 [Klebsiella michiganensis]